jgi:hypothetical protein
MHTTRYHVVPMTRSVLVAGRRFGDAGRALEWARRTAKKQRLSLAVWRVCPAGPVRLKLLCRVDPA